MRTNNSLRNIAVTIVCQAIKLILNFIVRMLFIKILVSDYLGLEGLFSNILSVLSLAELGIGQAISFALYKPLKENDKELIKSIMKFFKSAYVTIGLFILIFGLLLNPFIPYFVNGEININENLYLVYSLYVLSVGLSYFSSYKRELINADQKLYVTNTYVYSCLIIMNVLQILGLLLFKKYYIFLLVKVIIVCIENILITRKANKLYPFLLEKKVKKINSKKLTEVKKNIVGTISFKVGKVVVNSTDNIIISKFLGLSLVGIYSNYRLIITSLTGIITQLFTSITASIGNLGAEENKAKSYDVYTKIYFIGFWIYSLCAICLYFLINDFITIWIGKKYLLDNIVVILICVNFFLVGISSVNSVFRDAYGLYWKGKFKPIIEVLVNLILSLLLVDKYGIMGVLLGTLCSNIFVNFWWESLILYKNIFDKQLRVYFKMFFKYLSVTLFIIFLLYTIFHYIIISNVILLFIIKIIIAFLLINVIYIILYKNKDEFKFYINIIKKLKLKMINKK